MASWAAKSIPALSGGSLYDMICVGSNKFVACGSAGYIITSTDGGQTWTKQTAAEANDWVALAFDGTTIVAVSPNGTHRVMTSTDLGVTWTARTAAEANDWNSICWSPVASKWIAVCLTSGAGVHQVMTSPDAVTWTPQSASSASQWTGVASSSSLIMAFAGGTNNLFMTSTDGVTWTTHAGPANFFTFGGQGSTVIEYSTLAGKFIIPGYDSAATWNNKTVFTTDATSFSSVGLTGYSQYFGLVCANALGGFIAGLPYTNSLAGTNTFVAESTDSGATFSAVDTSISGVWSSPAAWDDTTSIFIIWDSTPADRVLVGNLASAPPSITPTSGFTSGGESFEIDHGAGFASGDTVWFGKYFGSFAQAIGIVVVDAATIQGVTPPFSIAEVVSVLVKNASGDIILTLQDAFTYNAPSTAGGPGSFSISPVNGPMTGGTVVTITGNGIIFSASPQILFDGIPATSVSGGGTNVLTCTTPAHTPEVVDVLILDS